MLPIDIHDNEKVHLNLRKHWIILVRDTGATVLLGILPFFLLTTLGVTIVAPFNLTGLIPFGALLSSLWLLVIWVTVAVLWTNYYLDLWVVTDQRIISVDQIGLFNRKITTLELENIQEITVKTENIFETFLHFGTINIETASPENDVAMEGIPHPERIRALILDEANRFRKSNEDHEAQKEMFRTASHEIKNYLTKDAAALAEIAEGSYDAHPVELKSAAARALSETRKGVKVAMDILDAARSGQLKLDRKPFDFAHMLRELSKEYEMAAKKKGLAFEITASSPLMVNGDEEKLGRLVLKNLFDNALNYTPGGAIKVVLEKEASSVRLFIADTGVGLTEEDMQKLFTPGGKGTASSETNPHSTGYGLSIAKAIVEAHGGRIGAESDGKGKGSVFIVELPAAQ